MAVQLLIFLVGDLPTGYFLLFFHYFGFYQQSHNAYTSDTIDNYLKINKDWLPPVQDKNPLDVPHKLKVHSAHAWTIM